MKHVSSISLALACALNAGTAFSADGTPYPLSKTITKVTWDSNIIRIGTAGNGGKDGAGDNWAIT